MVYSVAKIRLQAHIIMHVFCTWTIYNILARYLLNVKDMAAV